MKRFILGSNALLLFLGACTKEPATTTPSSTTKSKNSISDADFVYHYKGMAYPLHLEAGTEGSFVQDESYLALQQATQQGANYDYSFSNHPSNHSFLFDNEWEMYNFMEADGHAKEARHFKLLHRIEELRTALSDQYGTPLDFKNPAVQQAAQVGVQRMYEELNVITDFPQDLETFLGVQGGDFVKVGQKTNHVCTVYEHDNLQGQFLDVETASNTVIWTYGLDDCYTMAANPDLSLEYKLDGTNWNDCISSRIFNYVVGADAMGYSHFKDSHFAKYGCSWKGTFFYRHELGNNPSFWNNMRDLYWGGFLCGHQNDQITSIRLKAVWQGCEVDFSDL